MNITRQFLQHTGLAVNEAASLLAVHPITVRKWMADMQRPSVHAHMVMALIINDIIGINDIQAITESINEHQ